MKLCRDCRWIGSLKERHTRCMHPSSTVHPPPSPVTGESDPPRQDFCLVVRKYKLGDMCGPDAQHWEPAGSPHGVGFI
jgi:hypothetical protein